MFVAQWFALHSGLKLRQKFIIQMYFHKVNAIELLHSSYKVTLKKN